jgi:hypothetical protein
MFGLIGAAEGVSTTKEDEDVEYFETVHNPPRQIAASSS